MALPIGRETSSLNGVSSVPFHVGIIMDGNGRWAQARGLPRTAGHRAGIENIRQLVETATQLAIGALTLYAFSTENWGRPREEVDALMRYCKDFARREMDGLHKKNVKLQFLGRRQPMSNSLLGVIDESVQLTRHNTGLILSIALNYGGRAEIIDAARTAIQACAEGRLAPDDLDEVRFAQYLYTGGLPDPDLIIRTGGEQRLSNFLIWQAPGAVFWTTRTLWPDFAKADFSAAIAIWQRQSDQDRPNQRDTQPAQSDEMGDLESVCCLRDPGTAPAQPVSRMVGRRQRSALHRWNGG